MKLKIFINIIIGLLLCTSISAQSKKDIKNNNISSETTYITINENGKEITYKDSYTEYNDEGNVTEQTDYLKDGSIKHKETNKYNSQKKKVEETVFDAKDKTNKRTVFTYNDDNKKESETEYNDSGKLIKQSVFTYNKKGFKIEKKTYDANKKLIATKKYIYKSF